MSGPNLSEYFQNDAPSMFDEIISNVPVPATPAARPSLTANDASTTSQTPNIQMNTGGDLQMLEQKVLSNEYAVDDAVRDMWQTIETDPNILPILTMPGLQSPIELVDTVRAAVTYLLGETEANQRQSMTVEQVPPTIAGIQTLIESGCLRAAANLTHRLLTNYGQGFGRAGQPTRHSPHSLQLWFTRLALLVKLGEFDLCKREADAFGLLEQVDMYYEFYPDTYNNRTGSIVPFAFRLLIARLPSYFGSYRCSLDRLTDLLLVCTQIKDHFDDEANKAAKVFWAMRQQSVLCALINCALQTKDFSLADCLMERLTKSPELDADTSRQLYSTWGRIFLQCGDVFGAERKFSEARRIRVAGHSNDSDMRDFIDKGLIAVAQNDFKEAYAFFQKALAIQPVNALVLNNIAVCLLYLGRQKDAIAIFEQAIQANEPNAVSESLVLNLCTLYELESSNDVSKKLSLLKQINRCKSELNINIEYCFKLSTGNK